ncbi:hypothetical protein IQ07DRAFT_628833 [Pyrenochaeta sp. DS3sAY3a]|nr:hypothetical protein IQ07DRAFT_628833 [Pyrenochaeta sp. DS3sAY3a]
MRRSTLSTMSLVALPKSRSAKEDSAMDSLRRDISKSNIYRVLAAFKDLQNGKFYQETPSDVDLPITVDEYKQVLHFLDKHRSLGGLVRDKIRYDYDQDDCILTLRMLSGVHERLCAVITKEIGRQLDAIGTGSGRQATFARRVEDMRSTSIKFPGRADSCSPDASFKYRPAKQANFVLEVSYSEMQLNLYKKADKYMRNSKGLMQEFRNSDGDPIDHAKLTLHLSDFAPTKFVKKHLQGEDADIIITGKALCDMLNAVERTVAGELDTDDEASLPSDDDEMECTSSFNGRNDDDDDTDDMEDDSASESQDSRTPERADEQT